MSSVQQELSSEVDPGDLLLIDEALALSPEERLHALELTLKSLEALRVATNVEARELIRYNG